MLPGVPVVSASPTNLPGAIVSALPTARLSRGCGRAGTENVNDCESSPTVRSIRPAAWPIYRTYTLRGDR